jgi:hypothetical protein
MKKLTDLALKTQNIELQEGILQLREQLLSVKETLLNNREETLALKEENSQLREKVKQLEAGQQQEELILQNGLYYKASGDGPFCTACYDSQEHRIRVSEMPSAMSVLGKYECPVCKARFGRQI